MNLTAIYTAIQALGAFESDTQAQQLIAVNAYQRWINGAAKWPWTIATDTSLAVVASTSAYTLPAAVVHILDVELQLFGGKTQALRAMPEEELRERVLLDTTPIQTGTPAYWARGDNDKIVLWPIPNGTGTLSIRYRAATTDLLNGSDTPVMDPEYHHLLVLGGCIAMCKRSRDWFGATEFQNDYDTLYARMKANYGLSNIQTSDRVVDSGVFGLSWRDNEAYGDVFR